MDSISKQRSGASADGESQAASPAPSPPAKPFAGVPAGAEVEAAVREYYISLAEDNYENVVALMLPGMTVYTPYGPLMTVPQDTGLVLAIYKQIHPQGFHINYTPKNIDGVVYADNALATFMLEGEETAPGGSVTKAVRRGTQMWQKVDGRWRLRHMHVSTSDEWEHWRVDPIAK